MIMWMNLSKQAETSCVWHNTVILITCLLFPLRAIFHFCLRLRSSFFFFSFNLIFFFPGIDTINKKPASILGENDLCILSWWYCRKVWLWCQAIISLYFPATWNFPNTSIYKTKWGHLLKMNTDVYSSAWLTAFVFTKHYLQSH